ncbi:LysR family transcriptional regulator [Okibacterium fritillariae]|uniref:LysR family transcriptional regulator n=1 Tax=Okibacterium fritillariae TaxID=123320 RepID=UPI0040553BD1
MTEPRTLLAADLDSQTLRVVRAIADTGSITAAAARLGYSQPAVSQTVRRLEQRLGMPVLTRVPRGALLTEAGDILARHAATVLRSIDSAAEELAELAGLRTGWVRIAAFPSASSTIVPRLIERMSADYPGLRFRYIEAEPPEAVQAVRDHTADIALTFSYPGDPDDPHGASAAGLTATPLWREDMILILRRDAGAGLSPDASPLALDSLAGAGWIAGCPRCRGHLLHLCAAHGFTPSIDYETDNVSAVLAMVEAGLGVALLPSLALASVPLPANVVARHPATPDSRTVHLVSAEASHRVPAIAATIAAIDALDTSAWGLATARS